MITDCMIVSNYIYGSGAQGGGGVYAGFYNNAAYLAVIRNSLIAYNRAAVSYGGGLIVRFGQLLVQNCTIVSNYATSTAGGAYLDYAAGHGPGIIENTIIYYNSSDGTISNWISGAGEAFFTNSCAAPLTGMGGANNTDANPLFVSRDGGNFRLTRESLCINTGVNRGWMLHALDLGGHCRLDRFSGIVDMGCYEYVPGGAVFTIK